MLPENFQWGGDSRHGFKKQFSGDARAGNFAGGLGVGRDGGSGGNQHNPQENFNRGNNGWNNRNNQPGYNQQDNRRPFQPDRVQPDRVQPDRNGRGQLDGQMPELVKQYLLNTLLKDGKRY